VNQSTLFQKLGAPLANNRWSWGAVRSDGTVFLRVWKDRIRIHDGSHFVQVTHHKSHDSDTPANPGHRERLEHVSRIQGGAPCYLIICEAEDTESRPRRVQCFNELEVFPGGRVAELDGEQWVEQLPGVPVDEVAPSPVEERTQPSTAVDRRRPQ
jgi:hypothetical protein